MATENVAGIGFELTFDGSKMMSGINSACDKIKSKITKSFTEAGKSSTKAIETSNEEINKILNDSERSAKSKAASIASIYKKQGYSASEAMEKAWSHIERSSSSASKEVKSHMFGMSRDSKQVANGITNNFSNAFRSIAKKAVITFAAAFSVKKLVDFGKQCVELGSDLAEVQNVVDVTFPKMSAQVDQFAKSAAESFGLSETMAKKFTGTFGSMAEAFGFSEKAAYEMSTTLTGLAGDVASFYNISQDEAYTKLKSVFTGETETLKDLGIVMTQSALDAYAMANGYGKTTQAMSEAEKVALRYAFVQDQLANATGDFARTSDSWANQVRILKLNFDSLKATIGQGLINVLTPVLKVINSLLSKLSTLASAFKSFTEMLTGNKGSGGSGFQSTASELSDASAAADDMASSTSGIGDAAEDAAKKMNLLNFDRINKVSSSNSSGSSSGTDLGGNVDFGTLAEGETVVDKLDNKVSGLLDQVKDLSELFKKGFTISFGDSEKKISTIQNHIKNIGKSIKDIFTDKSVTLSGNHLFDSIALNAGKVAGSMANIGLTIADNLVGGFDSYLQESKDYIKERIVSVFDATSEISELIGDYYVAIANIFSVLSGENAKQCTASIIGIFLDAFLGVVDIASQFSSDVLNLIASPFISNQEKIKSAIDNTLNPIAEVLKTLHDSVKLTFEKIGTMYSEHVHPMFQSFTEGFTEIFSTLLNGYNEYVAPVLDALAEKFGTVWKDHVQPTIDKGIELFGKIADVVKAVWDTILQPLLNWIASKIMPVISLVLGSVGNIFLDTFSVISDVLNGFLTVLGGVLDIIAGILTGDWKRVWEGFKDVFKGVWEAMAPILKGPINSIIGYINALIRGIVAGLNTVISALNGLSFDIPKWVPKYGGKTFGFSISKLTAPEIPYLAQGGFVKANTPQLAMIGDNRHYGEVVAPEDKLQAMVDSAVQAASGSGITKAELQTMIDNAVMRIVAALASLGFYVDGEELAKAVLKAIDRLDGRYNPVKIY